MRAPRALLCSALLVIACNKASEGDTAPGPSTSSPTDAEDAGLAPSPRLYRLTHDQWENTVQDLLRASAPPELAGGFIGDTLHGGFDNEAEQLSVTPELFLDYQRAAEALARDVVEDAELYARVVPQDPREGGVNFELRVEVEKDPEMTADNGDLSGQGWMLWSDGTLAVPAELPTGGRYTMEASLSSSTCGDGIYGTADLAVDGTVLASVETSGVYEVYAVEAELSAGPHQLQVVFTNDCWIEETGEDRNLVIDWIGIRGAAGALGESEAGPAEAAEWIADIGRRAWRRPLRAEEQAALEELFTRGPELVASGDDFADGVELVLAFLLQSPHFLYRIEESTDPGAEGAPGILLNDWELASKLSYALWQTMPDDRLLDQAAADALSTEEQVVAQALAMLEDPRARQTTADFHDQLLALDRSVNIAKDPDHFPEFSEEHPGWMREEAERFIEAVLWEDAGGLIDLLQASYSVVNGPLAELYGVSGPPGSQSWQRVELPADQRAGLLTQSYFLAVNADATTPSPIHRGVHINRDWLCADLPDPPPDFTGLPEPEPGMSNRELVESHTGDGTCGEGCHSTMINPPGFALENYDALGRFQTEDAGGPIDASGSYYFGDGEHSWVSGLEFIEILATHPDTHRCYTSNWLAYLLARGPAEADAALIDPAATASAEGLPVQELIAEIASSEAFRYRVDEETP